MGSAPVAAGRMAAVADPVIARVGALVRQRPGALSLAQGMVAWGPPPGVRTAVLAALEAADHRLDRYGPVQGEEPLLEAVRRELTDVRGLDLEGSDLWVTTGSNMAFSTIAQVLCDPGDEVLLPLPFYFNHAMAVRLAGGVPVPVDAGLVPDPDRFAAAITSRTRAIVTISPNNPSGRVTPPAVLAAINGLCDRHGLLHVSDEAYADFVHGRGSPTAARAGARQRGAHRVPLLPLQGLRHGRLAGGLCGGAPPADGGPGQGAGHGADLPAPGESAGGAGRPGGRARLVPAPHRRPGGAEATAAGGGGGGTGGRPAVELLGPPDGAFYGLLRCPCRQGGLRLMERLVLEHGVAVLPGESFGLPTVGGQGLLRLSYGMLGAADLEEALGRLFRGLEALGDPGR